MLKNYLMVSVRNLRKHFSYSLINIFGLGLGLATCLLLVTWIEHELSFEDFHEKRNRIYRASLEYSYGGQTAKTAVSPTALLPAVKSNFAEVEEGVRLYNPSSWSPFTVKRGEHLFQEEKFFYADSTLFKVFTYKLVEGNEEKALVAPLSVVITQSTAKKYFGNENAVGKTLYVNNTDDYTVTGVIEDLPSNSRIQFDFVASFSSLPASKEQIWWSANYETYFVLAPGADVHNLQEKTAAIVKKELNMDAVSSSDYVVYNFMPLTDIYLKSDMSEHHPVGNIQYVYIFGAIAGIVLLIACINYVNLATARAADRAKEVGIRKVVGAVRKQLFFQFIGESLVITFLSLLLAFTLAKLSLPLFNALSGKNFGNAVLLSPTFIASAVLIAGFIAFAAGAYPALAITSFSPSSVLKGNFKTSTRGIWLRQGLVVLQFFISIVLIIGTFIVLKQLNYIQEKKLGYSKDNVVILPMDYSTRSIYSQVETEILKSGIASHVGRATESPTKINGGYTINIPGTEQPLIVTAMPVDEDFVPALGMKVIAGRNITEQDLERWRQDTTYAFLLNETALQELSLDKEQAVDMAINLNGRQGRIAGILEDFHFSSMHEKITPLVLFNEEPQFRFMFIKLKDADTRNALTKLEAICSKLIPHRPFEYAFLDQKYDALYRNEQRMSNISVTFAALTIIIACLGLFGLVSFSASQKTKEIGIRKVLGATPSAIVMLITRDFSRLILIAIVGAIPAAYWLMAQWLNDFAYKTDVGAMPYIIASVLCLVIAFATASVQAVRAAMIDPVNTLRSE